MFSLIFVIPGNIMLFPLSTAVQFYAETERLKALKASTVKVKANDVLASVKVLAYISTFPIYLVFFTWVFNRVLRWYYHYDRPDAYIFTVIFYFIFPVLQMISIRSHYGVVRHYEEFQSRFLSLFFLEQVDLIYSARVALKAKVEKAVNLVGP
jgi:glycerol-3-phosphate O-acyltransferase/dihydroxyacetone phosphate acyltransferase